MTKVRLEARSESMCDKGQVVNGGVVMYLPLSSRCIVVSAQATLKLIRSLLLWTPIKTMPHIALPPNKPGMVALGAYRPDIYSRLGSLANLLLHQEHSGSTLSPGERELIATYVSSLNGSNYCQAAHGSIAAAHLQDSKLVEDVKRNFEGSGVSPKMKLLLSIASMVQRSGKDVSSEAVEKAKKEGASDMDVHDTVLIAAMFYMFNRYVDGLRTEIPSDMEVFVSRGAMIAERGYMGLPVSLKTEDKDE